MPYGCRYITVPPTQTFHSISNMIPVLVQSLSSSLTTWSYEYVVLEQLYRADNESSYQFCTMRILLSLVASYKANASVIVTSENKCIDIRLFLMRELRLSYYWITHGWWRDIAVLWTGDHALRCVHCGWNNSYFMYIMHFYSVSDG